MIQSAVTDGDTTSNIYWDPITAEKLAKPSGKMVILANLLQKLHSGGHKVLVFSQMVCVLDFLEDLLRVKQSKYERLDGSKSASHRACAVDWFFRKLYQRDVMILRKIVVGIVLDFPEADTDVIFDNNWNPQLRTTLSPLCTQQQ